MPTVKEAQGDSLPHSEVTSPLVSMLVCTYNRATILKPTLASLIQQEFNWGEFEILVIDNASTDETKEIVKAFQARDERVRYAYEPRLGVAIARNTGARISQAPYIAYFDDDLLAEPDCLHQLMIPFFEVNPAPAAVMGKVDLMWEDGRPEWFPKRFETLLSRFDRGNEARPMQPDEYLLTMNVAFERRTFLETGGMREDLSRKGRMFICGGDTEVFQRYMDLSLPVYYQPQALVHHLVPANRQTRRWLLKRLFGDGTTQAILSAGNKGRWAFVREIYIDLRRSLRFLVETLWGKVSGDRSLAEQGVYKLIQRVGRLYAHWNLLIGNAPRAMSE